MLDCVSSPLVFLPLKNIFLFYVFTHFTNMATFIPQYGYLVRGSSFRSCLIDGFFVRFCWGVSGVAGSIVALSVLSEKKARLGELALYVLPRAVDSWQYILVNRHLLPDIALYMSLQLALYML